MALESLTLKRFYIASDVWSFGVYMWEVMAYGDVRARPFNPVFCLFGVVCFGCHGWLQWLLIYFGVCDLSIVCCFLWS